MDRPFWVTFLRRVCSNFRSWVSKHDLKAMKMDINIQKKPKRTPLRRMLSLQSIQKVSLDSERSRNTRGFSHFFARPLTIYSRRVLSHVFGPVCTLVFRAKTAGVAGLTCSRWLATRCRFIGIKKASTTAYRTVREIHVLDWNELLGWEV